jgi:hypothetical protein
VQVDLNRDGWWDADAVVHYPAVRVCEVSVLSGSFLGSQTLRLRWRAVKQRMSDWMNILFEMRDSLSLQKMMGIEQREIAALIGGKFDRELALVNKE